jgi:uncharacterized protein (DUF488 family)
MKKETTPPLVFALGHSTRPIGKLVGILESHGISTLVDIRTVPRSRRNPQFDGAALHATLADAGIGYVQMKDLGGLRRPVKGSLTNAAWLNDGFRGFADYMQSERFDAALGMLVELAGGARVAIMCAEGNPFRCHRSLVADALEARGTHVVHISGAGEGRRHKMTRFANVVGTRITYPRRGSP